MTIRYLSIFAAGVATGALLGLLAILLALTSDHAVPDQPSAEQSGERPYIPGLPPVRHPGPQQTAPAWLHMRLHAH